MMNVRFETTVLLRQREVVESEISDGMGPGRIE